MKNELFSIGPFTVYGYGLMVGIGIIAAYLWTEHGARKKGLDAEPVFALTVCSVIGGFLGSKLLYTLTRLKDIIADPAIIREVASGWVVLEGSDAFWPDAVTDVLRTAGLRLRLRIPRLRLTEYRWFRRS